MFAHHELHNAVVSQYDISLPLDRMYDLVKDVRERCKDMARTTVGYGHLGDGKCVTDVFCVCDINSVHSCGLFPPRKLTPEHCWGISLPRTTGSD